MTGLPSRHDRDSGAARVRTELAWTRTAVSFAALGAAILRTGTAAGTVAGLLVMAAGAAVCGLGYLSARPSPTGHGRLSGGRSAALITVATALVSVLALIVAVTTVVRMRG